MTTTTTATDRAVARSSERATYEAIPFSRIVSVELRKTFDTRSGAWLLASIAITAAIATVVVVLVAPDSALTYETFATAVGFPVAIILPMVAILSVTSEWSQRTGLTTFTFVPDRGRVIAAKATVSIGIGVVSMLLAAGVGAVGNLVGTMLTGTDAVWDISVTELGLIILANVLGLLVGFALGVLVRSSAAAIVAYFVYSLVLPPLSVLLAASQDWWRDLQPWLDLNVAQGALFEGSPDAAQWAHLATSGMLWLAVPLAVGTHLVLRSEVK